MLSNKTIVLGVSGSIAAYKIANLASMLVKQHAAVHVIMTRNACNFITPITFETLTGNKCLVDTFDRNFELKAQHVALAKRADLFLIAPATANVIAKMACGICDDMLTTTVLATKAPVLLAPAMNTNMWTNPILRDNLQRLERFGYTVIQPDSGRLACGDIGDGKLPAEDILLQHILLAVAKEKDLQGKRILISAGPTREAIDPVRFITNHSSGKMGYALAKMARLRGAAVMLVSGPVDQKAFVGVEVVNVVSAAEMYREITLRSADSDIIIMCSAVADYTPAAVAPRKMKKTDGDTSIALTRTADILKYLGEHKPAGQLLVGFSMETENLLENSRAKLNSKHADLICANTISGGVTGFGVDTNQVTIISQDGVETLHLCSKEETADKILDAIKAAALWTNC